MPPVDCEDDRGRRSRRRAMSVSAGVMRCGSACNTFMIIRPVPQRSTKPADAHMTASELRALLDDVAAGAIDTGRRRARICSTRCAPRRSRTSGFARVDHHRAIRQGFPEVVLGLGKTPAQIAAIAGEIVARGSHAARHARRARRRSTPCARSCPARRITPTRAPSRCVSRTSPPGNGHDPGRVRRHVRPAGRRRSGASRRS